MSKKLKYVINTIEHYDTALKILKKSLLDEGVSVEDIIYVYANSKDLKIKKNEDNILCIYVPVNLYEFSAFVGIAILILKETSQTYINYNYLFLHDTCKALRGFRDKSLVMNNFIHPNDIFHIVWAHTSGRHNIGMFSGQAVVESYQQCLRPIVSGQVGFDKSYAIRMEWDLVPESLRNIKLPQKFVNKNEGICLYPIYTLSSLYSKEKLRDIVYLTSLNLVKYYVKLGPIKPGNFASHHPQSII